MKNYIVNVRWDEIADVWWAESNDVPGLVSEASTFPELVKRVMDIAPELIELNENQDEANDHQGTLVFNSVHVESLRTNV